jgi:hypothetical protein
MTHLLRYRWTARCETFVAARLETICCAPASYQVIATFARCVTATLELCYSFLHLLDHSSTGYAPLARVVRQLDCLFYLVRSLWRFCLTDCCESAICLSEKSCGVIVSTAT